MKRNKIIIAGVLVALLVLALVSCTKNKKGPASTGSSATDRYNHGIALLENGDYKGAIVEFEASLRTDPKNYDAIKNLAGAYVEEKQWDQARAQYGQAQAMRPDDPSIYANLAYVYSQLGEQKLAWEMVNTAKQKDPNYPLTYYRTGELYYAEGKNADAVKAFNEYMAIEPSSRLYTTAKQIVDSLQPGTSTMTDEQKMKEDALAKSAIEAEKIAKDKEKLAKEKEDLKKADEKAKADEKNKKPDDKNAKKPDDKNAKKPDDKNAKKPADTKTPDKNKKPEPAKPAVKEAPKAPPPPPEPKLTGDALYKDRLKRGRQARAKGDNDAAIKLLTEAYGVHPNYAQVNYELGLAYVANGDGCEGKEYLEKYIKLETDEAAKKSAEERVKKIKCG